MHSLRTRGVRKFKKSRFISHTHDTSRILEYLDLHVNRKDCNDLYYFVKHANPEKRKITCQLNTIAGTTRASYDDVNNPHIQRFSHILACELRQLVNKNVYFDILMGKLVIFV